MKPARLRSLLAAVLAAGLLPAPSRALGPAAAAPTRTPTPPSRALQKAADDYWRFLEAESLSIRVREGLPVDRMPDVSFAHAEANVAFGQALAKSLDSIRERALAHEETLTLAILRREAAELSRAPQDYWLTFPVTPYAFSFLGVHQYFASARLASKEDAERYAANLDRYADLIRALGEKLSEQARRRIFLAREEIPLAAAAFDAAGREKEQSLFWVKDERLSALTPAERSAFRGRVDQVLASRVVPAVRRLIGYMTGSYAAGAPEAVGVGRLPGGPEHYRALVARTTTLDVSPEEIHRIGVEGVERLTAELDAVRAKAGFSGSVAEFRQFLKTDARFFAKTPEEVGERLIAAQNRILPKVPLFFGKAPEAPFGVERLERQLEGALTFGYYQPPTPQEPKGRYKYNGSRLSERSLLMAGALISHELVPGHHFQIALQRENDRLPKFRRESAYTAFTEGWGEYASDLAGPMGMYEDPYDRAGRIAMDLFLTSRLVVDTGMNLLGWPRAKAVAFLKENTLQSDAEIETETLRYCCDLPSQALAYKMGMMTIVSLREKARKGLGAAFDIGKFHDAVLSSGSLPLDVLEKHVDWFIRTQKPR